MEKFSVLMSVYIKEKASYFNECMESIVNQTILPSEIVLVEDGPISEDLDECIQKYISTYPDLIKVVPLKNNLGLGLALASGIPECSYELIARMDTDDICRNDRFELQLKEFEKDPKLDVCGSHIKEFSESIDEIISSRIVPLRHEEIAKYQKQRDAVNHVTVMFRKSAVIAAGNYQDAPLMEDSFLWVRMLQNGSIFKNIDDFLVFVRTGYSMIERRGGLSYLKKYIDGRKQILRTGYINYWDYYKTVFAQLIVSIVPSKLRLFIFTKVLR